MENTDDFRNGKVDFKTMELTDAGSLYEYARDPQAEPIAGWPSHRKISESRGIIENVLCGAECHAICLKQDIRLLVLLN